jgi:signal transduction histidine kinase
VRAGIPDPDPKAGTRSRRAQGTRSSPSADADLANLIRATGVAAVFVDRHTRIRRVTPGAAATGFRPSDEEELLSEVAARLGHAELADDLTGVMVTMERQERQVVRGDARLLVRIEPCRGPDGQFDGAIVLFFDHTERHRLEDELREAQRAADAAIAARGIFLSTLSHELRTPLSAMIGYADIMHIGGTLNDEQTTRIERIKAAGRHLDSMIDQLLDFARLDQHRMAVDRETGDARQIAEDVRMHMQPLAAEKQLTFSVDVPKERLELTTDMAKVRQVLLNLCGNAIKYTAVGGVTLSLRHAGERVVFEVSDTGPGIAPEHHTLIFDRFWQIDGGATRVDRGLGIGLAAAREYARLLGGEIELESEVGQGSTFRLSLPRDPSSR